MPEGVQKAVARPTCLDSHALRLCHSCVSLTLASIIGVGSSFCCGQVTLVSLVAWSNSAEKRCFCRLWMTVGQTDRHLHVSDKPVVSQKESKEKIHRFSFEATASTMLVSKQIRRPQ